MNKPSNPAPQREHAYTEHPTYTGVGCAICGQLRLDHDMPRIPSPTERAPAREAPPPPTPERLRYIADYLLGDLEEERMALDIRAVADWLERQQREGNHG